MTSWWRRLRQPSHQPLCLGVQAQIQEGLVIQSEGLRPLPCRPHSLHIPALISLIPNARRHHEGPRLATVAKKVGPHVIGKRMGPTFRQLPTTPDITRLFNFHINSGHLGLTLSGGLSFFFFFGKANLSPPLHASFACPHPPSATLSYPSRRHLALSPPFCCVNP